MGEDTWAFVPRPLTGIHLPNCGILGARALVDNSHQPVTVTLRYLASLFAAFVPLPVFAQPFFFPGGPGAGGVFGESVVQGYGPPARDLPNTILNVINFVLLLVGVLALAFLVYGGFLYITSHGEEDKVTEAKETITNAVIGIVVLGIAAAVVNFVIGAVLTGF